MRISDKELHRVLMRYDKETRAEDPEAARLSISLVVVFTITKSIKSTESVARGQMMWYQEFMDHALTSAGGGLTPLQAEQKWKKLVDHPDSIQDKKGPSHSALRVRVSTHNEVNFLSTTQNEIEVRSTMMSKKMPRKRR